MKPAARLIDSLRPGLRVFVSTLSAESALLRTELQADPDRARGVTFCGVQFPGIDRTDFLALHPQTRVEAHFMTPAVRAAQAGGRADLLALDYRGIARHALEGPAPDLVIAQLTPPDAEGWCSPGPAVDFMPLLWARAGRRIAHLNPGLPRSRGSFRVHVSELDAFVEAEAATLHLDEGPPGDVELRIGQHAAQLVHDGDTLQFGLGGVPQALGRALRQHRHLRLHGGMVSASLRTLWEAGALDRDSRITSGVVFGDAALHDFATTLPNLWLTDVRTTHEPALLAAIPRFVAINSALEVDLFGQVNAERSDGRILAGAGGLPAFAQGAMGSAGGRLLICLRATARQGSRSRIVPVLGAASLCTLSRHYADAVITEHGVAELRGLSIDARAQALIGIADPGHRETLTQAWDLMRRSL